MIRFNIRDMLWLMVMVGMGAAWWLDHAAQERRLREEKAAAIETAVRVQEDWLRRYRGE